ncbi:hypothetical protein [uncultured Kriegella sp.]|uniref:hypothetical protein n=1 Tax=uncultured Kriegella sp. TaxID=1798910 RepID=UPI0030D6E1E7|tara:strand:+ start:6644 stop:7006 length:363 start_codon:yes stop_codon:yes gene_type:complete
MIITNNKNQDNEGTSHGLENKVPQNSNQEQNQNGSQKDSEEAIGKPVNNGGVKTVEYEPQLEKQWLAVRDEYRAHYPELEEADTEYEEGGLYEMIDRLAKRRQRSPKEIQREIMKWSLIK